MQNRIKYIDISKAFAIIFIVLGHALVHSENCKLIFKFLYSFHVVLFFILSGMTFVIKEPFLPFFKKKFKIIMIPYFIWAILFLIPYLLFGSDVSNKLSTNSSFDLKTLLINILYGNGNNSNLKQNSSLWFLPALFSMEIFYYFVIALNNKYKKLNIVTLLLSLLIGYISVNYLKIILPFGINTVLNIGIFFFIGYLIKNKDFKKSFNILLFIIGLFAFYYNSSIVACIDYKYGNFTLAFLSGFCLSILVINISKTIKSNKFLEYIGKNTLGILIFHKLIILVFQTKLSSISMLLKNSNLIIEFTLSIIITFISIIISLFICSILKKYCPEIIGEKR